MLMSSNWKARGSAWIAATLLAFVAVAADAAPERQYSVAPLPEWVDMLATPALVEGQSGDRAMLLVDNQVSLLDTEPEWFYRRVSAVLAGSSVADAAELRVDFDPAYAQVILHGAWVERSGVRQDRLASARIETLRREERLEQQLLDGQLTLHVVLDDVRVGDIVEYAVSVRGDNPVLAGHFSLREDLSAGLPTQLRQLRVLRPADHHLESHVSGVGLEHSRTVQDGAVDERWLRRDLPALRAEDRVPAWFFDGPRVELSSMRGWDEVVAWALPLYAGSDAPEIATVAEELGLVRGRAEEADVLAAIRFVQDEIRYTGVELGAHAYTPYAPGEVLRRRYGDCKDKAQLLTGLLRYLGLRADPALVNVEEREHLAEVLPNPRAFDHVIVRFEYVGNEYWIDATVARQRGDLAHRVQADFGQALLIAPGERGLREMPSASGEVPFVDIEETIDLRGIDPAQDGPANYRIRTVYRGSQADRVRGDFASGSAESVGAGYTEWVGLYYPGSRMQAPPTTEDDESNNTFTVHEHYTIEGIWQDSENTAGMREATFWLSEIDRALAQPTAGARRSPWALGNPEHLRQRVTVLLDSDWPAADEPLELLTNHIDYTGRTITEGATLQMEGELRTFGRHVAADVVPAFRRDVGRIENTLGYTITQSYAADDGPQARLSSSTSILVDWRLLPLLGGLVMLWAWVIICGVKRSVSTRWGMLFRPRATVGAGIAVWRPWSVFVLLMASSLATDVLDPDIYALRETIGMGVIIAMMLALAFMSFAVAWLVSLLMAWVGRRFGGRGRTMDVVTAMAWSQVPTAALLPLTLLALALYGIDGLAWNGAIQTSLPAVLLWAAGLLPMALWATVLWFPAFATAQRFSLVRSIWATLVPIAVLVVLGIAVIVVARVLGGSG